jgi:septal ring factor EnvC (AmiA/AmiB activator)
LGILTLICFSESATEQGLEDAAGCLGQKKDIVIKGFEDKIKKLEDSLKEKDSLLRLAEDSLAEAHSQNEKLSRELDKARKTLEKNWIASTASPKR